MRRKRYDVCAAVVSDLPYDARVWKEVKSLRRAGYSVALVGMRYDIDRPRRRAEDEIDVTEFPLGTRAKVTRRRRLLALLQLWIEIIRTPAAVYHCHNIHPGVAAWAASRLRRAELVYDAHELYGDAEPGSGPVARLMALLALRLERLLTRSGAAVLTTNDSRADALRYRHRLGAVTVIHNVPRRQDEVAPLDPGFPPGRRILLYQGGIYPQYGFREAIEALPLLDNIDFVILGFGRKENIDQILEWTRKAGVSGRVHLLGPRPFETLVMTAAAATVGLVPINPLTTNLYLGDTNKLHDYLMAGLPLAASDLPEIRRVARQGSPSVGELYDPTSPESLAAAVRRIVDDHDTYAARRREARRLALEKFNWETEEPALLGVYRSLGTS
jgi:glycosyltransferase involved in cell wall biosynthesis